MNLAEAYANAGKALLDLADALSASEPGGPTRPQDAPGAPSLDELPADTTWVETDDWDDATREAVTARPHGSAGVCPAHDIEYRKGRYGLYCPSASSDPEWSNDRGYCRITPKNAAAYLREKARR